MAMADDAATIIGLWGEVLSYVTKAASYSNTGKPTVTWTQVLTPTGRIFPLSGGTSRIDVGQKIISTHEIYLENAVAVAEGGRIRPNGWVAGQDEYQITLVEPYPPSHVRCEALLVKGHGG